MNNKNEVSKKVNEKINEFQWFIWSLFAVENWILDFGRPIAMLVFPLDWFPLNLPSVGDYFHMAYNVITPFCLFSLMKKTSRKGNDILVNLCLIFFIMGASIHLVGDSINHRLSLIGYQFHLSLEDNPIMKNLQPKELIKSFELLYFYDEVLGHYMWYIPFFGCLMIYFTNCFKGPNEKEIPLTPFKSLMKNILILVSALYYWYLVTEGQITPLFVFTLAFMYIFFFYDQFVLGRLIDENGKFLIQTFQLTLVLVGAWCFYFWDDKELRKKYPGFIYVPEPWSVYSLHFKEYYNIF